jgi:PAS domain S-box-containing protein
MKHQHEIFESMFYQSTDGILIIENGIFVECNDAVVKMLKYESKEQFLNTHPSELSPEFQADGRSSFEKAEENTAVVLKEGSRRFEWQHLKADGTVFWVGVVLTDISSDEITRFLVVWRDIDARKNIELELEELNHNLEVEVEKRTLELQASAETLSRYVIFSRTDRRGEIIEVSDAFCIISGYEREELIGKSHSVVRHEDMPTSLFETLWLTIHTGKVWNGSIKNRSKSGDYYWVDTTITPEFDEDGNIVSFMSVRHDITAKVDYEELNKNLEKTIFDEVALSKQKDLRLFESDKMVRMGEMIGNIAHQWRQPLASIASVVNNLSMKQQLGALKANDIPEHVDKVLDYVEHLSSTINTFRNFMKDNNVEDKLVVQDVILTTLDIISATLAVSHIECIKVLEDEEIVTFMTSGELSHVLINILNNGMSPIN